MSLGPVMIDLSGTALNQEEREILQHPLVGGVILFGRNYESPQQVRELVSEIHGLRTPRLLVAVDHEGGRVQRFRDGFTRLPAVGCLGEVYRCDQKLARQYAEASGWLMASELLAVGVDFSFAPVLDLDRKVSSVIGDRAFHRQPEVAADLAHHYMMGMKLAGMMATGKHFPGHGAVVADSHVALPVDQRPYADIVAEEMLPFERMIHYGVAAIMMAHVVYPAVDDLPSGFSRRWIRDILRGQFRFQGVVFSDDLSMEGAAIMGGHLERARAALQAGCDMVLVCNSPAGRNQVLDGLSDLDSPVSHLRLTRMHGKPTLEWEALHESVQWRKAVELVRAYEPSPLLDMDME